MIQCRYHCRYHLPRIIQIPGRSGFYLRVAVPRGKLRDAFGTCDVVKKIGNTRKEAEENISSAEIAIQQKFEEKLREEEAKKSINLCQRG